MENYGSLWFSEIFAWHLCIIGELGFTTQIQHQQMFLIYRIPVSQDISVFVCSPLFMTTDTCEHLGSTAPPFA